MKNFKFNKLVIATNNKGKLKEITQLLKPFNVEILSASDFPYPEPVETGTTFTENAEIKSRYYAEKTSLPSLSDDSGLEVDALGGSPGVYSANWAETGSGRDFYFAMRKLEQELQKKNINTTGNLSPKEKEKLKCNFTCLLSLCLPDGKTHNFEGKIFGHLQFPPKGEKGFGYDPIFVANGYNNTFAEIDPEEKYRISHRANAFKKLKEFL